jgi:hypothetical protein
MGRYLTVVDKTDSLVLSDCFVSVLYEEPLHFLILQFEKTGKHRTHNDEKSYQANPPGK